MLDGGGKPILRGRMFPSTLHRRLAALACLALLTGGLAAVGAARRPRHAARAVRHRVGEAFVPSAAQHRVRAGDTLWDLTAQITGKPYVWPQIWALNPQVHNPHWIYPGDQLQFAPRRRSPRLLSSFDTTYADPPRATPKARTDGVARVFGGAFIAPKDFAGSGLIRAAGPDRLLLRAGDDMFVAFAQAPKAGERMHVFRFLREVFHPQTGELLGVLSEVTGEAMVARQSASDANCALTRVQLQRSDREVQRGQRLLPATVPLLQDVRFLATAPPVQATVVDLEGDLLTAGNQKLVFLDRGKEDGLKPGHGLVVRSQGDPLWQEDSPLPPQDVAWLLVVEAQPHTATCLVTAALREVWVGDTAVARSASPSAPL